jgi:Holliday junction resolvase-like predicted endonuclease
MIGPQKRNRIIQASKKYLHEHDLSEEKLIRYDIILLKGKTINHMENAFFEGGVA